MSGTGRARRFAAGAGALMLAAGVVLLAAPGAGAAVDREAQGGLTPPAVSVSGPAELTDNTAVFTFTVNTFGECGTAGLTGVDQTTGVSNDFRAGIVAFSAGTTGDQAATLSVGGLTPSSTYALTAFAVVTNCVNASQNVTADGNTVTFTASPGPPPPTPSPALRTLFSTPRPRSAAAMSGWARRCRPSSTARPPPTAAWRRLTRATRRPPTAAGRSRSRRLSST